MPTSGHLDLTKDGNPVHQKVYRSMIGSLLYLCASLPDIMLSVCMCAQYQARYLIHTPKFGIWYPKRSSFDLVGYSDSDYARDKVDRKSISGTCQFLGRSLVSGPPRNKTRCPYPPPKRNTLPPVHVVLNYFG